MPPRRATTDARGTEPSTTLRSEHVEATRRAVLAAARSAFGRKGYAQTSVDEIAAAARVTKGAVYHHFAGKEALFRAVHAEVEAEAQARAAGIGDAQGSQIDQIVARVDAYLDVALDEEVQRITLVDGPAVLGLELEPGAEEQKRHERARSFVARLLRAARSSTSTPTERMLETYGISTTRDSAWAPGVAIVRSRADARLLRRRARES